MEEQLPRPHAHQYDDPVNDSPLVRSGLVEPTVMGTPVLAEDLDHATRSDIVDQQQPSIGVYGTQPSDLSQVGRDRTYGEDESGGQLKGSFGKSRGIDPTNTGWKEGGITDVLQSFDKMKVYDDPNTKSSKSNQNEPNLYTGSHDQFAPERVENPPLDTISKHPSNPNSSYTHRISSAIADKASSLKDSIVFKMSSSDKNKTITKSSSPTDYAHMVAETLSGTLGPVYEKVSDTGSSVMSKMQGFEHVDNSGVRESKGVRVKEYLVNTFKPGDDDKMLSDVITHAFNRGKVNDPPLETKSTTTTCVVSDEGERRLQDSGN